MCGILGIASYFESVSADRLTAGLQAIAHRGPDGEGNWSSPLPRGGQIHLAHRRLSIFDLSSAGAQPMSDHRSRTIIFNGSIFNWPELRQELTAAGYRFHTQTDTEVILAAYDKWGPDCVKRFNGFWAFALFDGRPTAQKSPCLLFSRDRFGIKPLYYIRKSDMIVFASEIGALYASLDAKPRVDLPVLARQLVYQRGEDSDRTIYEDVYELEPATSALLDLSSGHMTRWRYWMPAADVRFEGSDDEALDRFSELFEDAVRIRLRADREVALTLSGGIDSSAIAAAISRSSQARVRAYTSHFPDNPQIDETHFASLVTNKLGMEHVLVQPDLSNIADEERKLTKHQEITYGSFSLLVNWAVISEIQKSGVRIFMTGQGGDEMFLGYERYYAPYLLSLLRHAPSRFAGALIDIGRNSRLGVLGAATFLLYFSNQALRDLRYQRDAAKVFSQPLRAAAQGRPAKLPMSVFDLQCEELCGAQLRHLLRYDDRTSAAFGTEGRPAFLDHRLVEFALSLDWDYKIKGGWTKYLLRRYLDRAGLKEIAWRKHKLGYNAPTLEWTNHLLSDLGDLTAIRGAGRLLRPGLTATEIPERMRFTVYNLLSTAREMQWAA